MPVRRRYFLFLCPDCGEQFQYAGWCDYCGKRLESQPCIPLTALLEFQAGYEARASAVPRFLSEQYVKQLLDSCGLSPTPLG